MVDATKQGRNKGCHLVTRAACFQFSIGLSLTVQRFSNTSPYLILFLFIVDIYT